MCRVACITLAFGPTDRYFERMSQTLRRTMTLLLALTFVMGLIPHVALSSDADSKMVMAAATDMPMSGKCDGCRDDQNGIASAACSVHCGSSVVLPVMGTVFEAVPIETSGHFAGPNLTGYTAPPNPYPPKPSILS